MAGDRLATRDAAGSNGDTVADEFFDAENAALGPAPTLGTVVPDAPIVPRQDSGSGEVFVDLPRHDTGTTPEGGPTQDAQSWREWAGAWLAPVSLGVGQGVAMAARPAGYLAARLWGHGTEPADSTRSHEPVSPAQAQQARQSLLDLLQAEASASRGESGRQALALMPAPTAASFGPICRSLSGHVDGPVTPHDQQAVEIIEHYIDHGEVPAQGAARPPLPIMLAQQILGRAAALPQSGRGAAAALGRAGQVMSAFLRRVNANQDFESTPATIAASVANVAMRNALAVFVPTIVRQFLSYGVEAGLTRAGASDPVRTTLGLMAPIMAVGALALGAMRDRIAGTHTRTSERSRAIMASTTALTGLATAATGSMPSATALMVSFTAYTAMRDLLVQSRLRLSNANTTDYVPDATHFALISAGYGIDQGLVSLGMSTLASPSGAGAYVAGAGVQAWNAIRRGAVNWAGEVGEDLMFQSIPAVRSVLDPAQQNHALRLSIRDVGYQQNNLVNGALGPWAVRTGILSTTIGGLSMLSKLATNPAYVNNPRLVEAVNDLIIGAVNGILYEPFANSGSAQPGPARLPRDLEAG